MNWTDKYLIIAFILDNQITYNADNARSIWAE